MESKYRDDHDLLIDIKSEVRHMGDKILHMGETMLRMEQGFKDVVETQNVKIEKLSERTWTLSGVAGTAGGILGFMATHLFR